MLKFWSNKYTLQPQTILGTLANDKPRAGALLKIEWPDKKVGYADLFPWPELGDESLDNELAAIAKGRLSPLVEQSIWMARKDAVARADKRNAFQGLSRVKNHFLINDPTRIEEATIEDAKTSGFATVKIKVGRNPAEELKWLDRFLKHYPVFNVRLDLNSSMTLPSFEKFIDGINPGLRGRIEFVEDPFPFHEEEWRKANELIPLALDHEFHRVDWATLKKPAPFKVLIIKPARQDVKKCVDYVNKFSLKMAITSSLDHAVGVAHALWVAGELKKFNPNILLDCGCLTLRSYRPNDFSATMIYQGPYLIEVPGYGIGFDTLFEKLTWTPLYPNK
jgi:O-succinylbenzoate synthase